MCRAFFNQIACFGSGTECQYLSAQFRQGIKVSRQFQANGSSADIEWQLNGKSMAGQRLANGKPLSSLGPSDGSFVGPPQMAGLEDSRRADKVDAHSRFVIVRPGCSEGGRRGGRVDGQGDREDV